MEENIPRSQAPQPNVSNMQPKPTSCTVSDVTVIGDSDDSLLLKSSRHWHENENKIQVPGSYGCDILQKENIPLNNNLQLRLLNSTHVDPGKRILQTRCQNHSNDFPDNQIRCAAKLPLPNNAVTPKVAKEDYNPETYMSPTASESMRLRLKPTLKTISPFRSCIKPNSAGSPVMYTDNRSKTVACQQNSPASTNDSPVIVSSGINRLNQSSFQESPLTTNSHESPVSTYDPNMTKLIEIQNEQIRYLQKLVEKLMEKSSIDLNKHCLEDRCSCTENKLNTPKNDLIVKKPYGRRTVDTRSVATNTDISWGKLYSNYGNAVLKRHGTADKMNSKNKTQFHAGATGTADKWQNHSYDSAAEEVSKAFKQVQIDTIPVYDHESPEPTDFQAPELDDEQCSMEDKIDKRFAHENSRRPAHLNEVQRSGRKPSSVLVFEKYSQREVLRHSDTNSPNRMKKGEKLEMVLMNLQKVIQEDEDNQDDEVDYVPTKDFQDERRFGSPLEKRDRSATSCIQVEQFRFRMSDQIHQMQHSDTRRGVPVYNSFIMDKYLQGGVLSSDFEDMNGPQRERFVPSRIPDAHLAAIAQNSPGLGIQLDRRTRIPTERHSSQARVFGKEFSIATEQFLGKYQLDDDDVN